MFIPLHCHLFGVDRRKAGGVNPTYTLVTGVVNVTSFLAQTSPSQLFTEVVISVGVLYNDNDGLPDLLDPDDVRDSVDALPMESTESLDTDGDGTGIMQIPVMTVMVLMTSMMAPH